MSTSQVVTLALLASLMVAAAIGLGKWAVQLNPDGIITHDPAETGSASSGTTDSQSPAAEPRNAFTFGASMALLGSGLLYCLIAGGLLLRAKSRAKPADPFIYWVAGLAVTGFALSYLVDDYFY